MAVTNAIDFEYDSLEYAETTAADLIESHATAFTCEFWLRPESTTAGGYTHMYIDNGGHYGAGQTNFCFTREASGLMLFLMYSGENWKSCSSNAAINNGTWYHICGIWDGSEMRLYIDGVKQTETQTFTSHDTNNHNIFAVGRWSRGSSGSAGNTYYCDGTVDELRISSSVRYTTNFTPSVIEFSSDANTLGLWHFNDNALDSGPNGYHLTEYNTPTYVAGNVSLAVTAVTGPFPTHFKV